MAIDLNKPFTGHYIEFFDIDATGIGGLLYHFAPSLDYDEVTGVTSMFNFDGVNYEPIPLKLTGVTSSTTGAPPTPTLTVSNITKRLLSAIIDLEGLVGATVTRHRTFSEYVPTNEELPTQHFIISQVMKINREQLTFKLNLPIDFEGTRLPFRTVLKDVGFPGVSRAGVRNG